MKFNVFAFSAPDFAARRTIVRLVRRNRTLQTILSLPHSVGAKKAQTENRLCRTLVRRRDVFRRFCIFFISHRFEKAKKAQTEKTKTDHYN